MDAKEYERLNILSEKLFEDDVTLDEITEFRELLEKLSVDTSLNLMNPKIYNSKLK